MGDNNTSTTVVDENKNLPESITIGETTYVLKTTPELMSLVNTIAKIEKSKLYTKIEALKKTAEQLSNATVQPTDLEGLKDSMRDEMTNIITKAIQPLLEKIQKAETTTVEEYRDKLILDNAATCIPELVTGNTKEELDASLIKSKEVRARFPENPSANGSGHVTDPLLKDGLTSIKPDDHNAFVNNNAANLNSNQRQKPITKPLPQMSVNAETTTTDISKMSQEEFAKSRDSLLKEISTLV